MSPSSSFDLLSFQRKVDDALRSVARVLELERKPRLAADVAHTYGAKYGLVNATTNAALLAYLHCLERLGLDAAAWRALDATAPATLRFEAATTSTFQRKARADVPVARSREVTEETRSGAAAEESTTTKVTKTIYHVYEYHWEVEVDWSISVYSGTTVDEKTVLKSHKYTTALITQSDGGPANHAAPALELSLSWLLLHVNAAARTARFRVDTEDAATKTPRRNEAVQQGLDFAAQLHEWCRTIEASFFGHLERLRGEHHPAVPPPNALTMGQLERAGEQYSIFNPILPLMEDARLSARDDGGNAVESNSLFEMTSSNDNNDRDETLLSPTDISKLLNEHVRNLGAACSGVEGSWPADVSPGIASSSEATLWLLIHHLRELTCQYAGAMSYVESMMEGQLIAAIGKRVTSDDLNKFVKFHGAKLLSPPPQPFSYAIRRPAHYPVGVLSIESHEGEHECIHSHSREVTTTSNLKIPLSASAVLELTGPQFLHGYTNHRFGTCRKGHRLVARARQFSSFVLVIGNMINGSTLHPKDAIIVQNKDELLIPLLLEELPTAREFKDAVQSLSPEQQRFARAYRNMQLASSVFGVCVVQIKPQLEALLGLPADALDKDMKLAQDLLELFVEYQVPSDMLSYDGFSDAVAVADKVSAVRHNVKGVMDVISAEKENQLKTEQAKTDMALEQAFRAGGGAGGSAGFPQASAERKTAPTRSLASRSSRRCGSSGPMMCSAPMMRSARPATPEVMDFDMTYSLAAMNDAEVGSFGKLSVTSHHPTAGEEEPTIYNESSTHSKPSQDEGVDFTLIPHILDEAVEKSGEGGTIRTTTIKTGNNWVRNRQENLLSKSRKQRLSPEEIKTEKNKAFDLLDALSRSGSLPIAYNELHVVIAVTHCFDKDVMSTVVCDNINPIEKLEHSTLLLASAVHGVPARELIGNVHELQRLTESLPLLLHPPVHE